MRQFTPLTNLLLTCLAAVGLGFSLGLPWYGSAPSASETSDEVGTIAGPIEGAAALVARWFSTTGTGTSGADALGSVETGLLGLAVAAMVLAAMMLIRPLAGLAREGLRVIPLAAPALVVLQMIDTPGAAPVELRWGAFTALGAGLLMASAAWHGAALRTPRKARATARKQAPAAPAPAAPPTPVSGVRSVAPPGV